jgi:hypothetical protein
MNLKGTLLKFKNINPKKRIIIIKSKKWHNQNL